MDWIANILTNVFQNHDLAAQNKDCVLTYCAYSELKDLRLHLFSPWHVVLSLILSCVTVCLFPVG